MITATYCYLIRFIYCPLIFHQNFWSKSIQFFFECLVRKIIRNFSKTWNVRGIFPSKKLTQKIWKLIYFCSFPSPFCLVGTFPCWFIISSIRWMWGWIFGRSCWSRRLFQIFHVHDVQSCELQLWSWSNFQSRFFKVWP